MRLIETRSRFGVALIGGQAMNLLHYSAGLFQVFYSCVISVAEMAEAAMTWESCLTTQVLTPLEQLCLTLASPPQLSTGLFAPSPLTLLLCLFSFFLERKYLQDS